MIEVIRETIVLGNPVLDYIIFIGIFLGSIILVKAFQGIILKRLRKLAKKTATKLDDFLVAVTQRIVLPMAYFAAFYMSVNTLVLDPLIKRIIDIILMALLTIFAARLVIVLITHGFDMYSRSRGKGQALERSLTGILRIVNGDPVLRSSFRFSLER